MKDEDILKRFETIERALDGLPLDKRYGKLQKDYEKYRLALLKIREECEVNGLASIGILHQQIGIIRGICYTVLL